MNPDRQWLELGLEALPAPMADRIRLFRQLLGTAATLRGRLDRELAGAGITTQQAALLQCVQAQGEAPTMGTVAQAMAMTHQNVKQLALVLQRKGFVEITIDSADRRARRLVLTAQHHRFWGQRNPSDFNVVESLSAGLDDVEVRTLLGLLARLRRSASEHGAGN